MTSKPHWGHFWVMSSAIQVQTEQLPAAELQSLHVSHLLKGHLWPHSKKHSSPALKTISNSWKSLRETSVFWNSLFRADPCTLSWDIILQNHLKPEAEAVYKDSTTIPCRKLSSQPSVSQLNGYQRKPPRLLPSSSHLLQLGVRIENKRCQRQTHPMGGHISSLRVKACPLLLPASSCWEKQSQSEVILFRGIKQSPNKSVFLLSFWHSPLPWSKQLPPYSGPQFFCLLHKPDQPSFLFLVSFGFSYICLPDLKSSVRLLCCWETS